MAADKIFINARFGDGTRHSITVSGGRITAILEANDRLAASETVDLGGELVVPGFVEGHIHLDTSFWGDVWRPHKPCTNGFNVHERVASRHRTLPKPPRWTYEREISLISVSRMAPHRCAAT